MSDVQRHEGWEVFEAPAPDQKHAEYDAYNEQAELPANEEAEHAEVVRRVAAEHDFPLSNWQPKLPVRD
jgi:hypothetical protein